MSLAPSHVALIEQWVALGGVPRDGSTRDFVCDELLFMWADRQAWVAIAEQLLADETATEVQP